MARRKLELLFIAVGGHAVALDPRTGDEVWRTKLKGSSSFATITLVNGHLMVGASGELFCLDPDTGAVRWHNKLKGLGYGVVAFPGTDPAQYAAVAAARAAAAAGAT